MAGEIPTNIPDRETTLFRQAWKVAGIVIAVEAIKALINLPVSEMSPEDQIQFLAVGLAIPIWVFSESEGWFDADLGTITSTISSWFPNKDN